MKSRLWILILTLISIFSSIKFFAYAQPINKSISLGPYPAGERYYVRVFNVDDVSRVKVNGREVLSVGYYQERDIDITPYLREGQNTIELILENTGGGWTYGYELKKGGSIIWGEMCGSVGREGCRSNDQTGGIVARYVINLAIQPAQAPVADRLPNVTSFSVYPNQIVVGQTSFRINFSVRDDIGLNRVELWRKDYDLGGRLRQDFREIRRQSISGTSFSGSFEDRPSEPGIYEYGVHVVDSSGKWNCERNSQTGFSPGIYGPIKVVAAPAPPKQPIEDWRIERAINWAKNNVGNRKYLYWCYTFVRTAFAEGGINLPKAGYAYEAAKKFNLRKDEIPPRGALVFYHWEGTLCDEFGKNCEFRNWGHVAISLGNGQVIDPVGIHSYQNLPSYQDHRGLRHPCIFWGWTMEHLIAQAPQPPSPQPTPKLTFESLTPSQISVTTAPYQAEFLLTGGNFLNVDEIRFNWSGAVSGSAFWRRGDRNWNSKVRIKSDSAMVIYPVVVEPDAKWSGTVYWKVTLKDNEGRTASKSFTVVYTPPTARQPLINKSISLGPYSAGERYYVRVFNVDDVSRVKVNGREVLSVGYYQERDIDITPYLREGQNTIELILENTGGGWTYGYELKKGGSIIWDEMCGSVGREGCRGNDQTKGIVARHLINLSTQPTSTPPTVQKCVPPPKEGVTDEWCFKTYGHGYCTDYVKMLAKEKKGITISGWGHAINWLDSAKRIGYSIGKEPMKNAIVVFNYSPYGHVAWVEEVKEDRFRISEWNYGKMICPECTITDNFGKRTERWINKNDPKILGFIYLEKLEPKPEIISDLKILESGPYKVGQTITAEFTIRNSGNAPITFDILTVGGRLNGQCPNNKCPDFTFIQKTLYPNESFIYRGKLKLELPGNYHFFTAYRTKDGQWNTSIPTLPGVKNTLDIFVSETLGARNPDFKTINNLLEEAARKYNVPPSLLKAIAWYESNWKHFDETTGKVIENIYGDGGIGIMQITDDTLCKKYNLDKYKLEDNIMCGALILRSKWDEGVKGSIQIGAPPDDPEVIENWWYATLAYNGFNEIPCQDREYLKKIRKYLLFPPTQIRDYIKSPEGWIFPWEAFNEVEFRCYKHIIDNFSATKDGRMYYIKKGSMWDKRQEKQGKVNTWKDYSVVSMYSGNTGYVIDTTIQTVQPSPEYAESTAPVIQEPENFRKIDDKIFTGGRPTIEQIRWLKEKVGIKSIINLERWDLREGYSVNKVRAMGIEYINSPVNFIRCPADDVRKALEHIKHLIQQGKIPIYVHCKEGVDRTGFVIAAYRVMVDGWDINKAIEKWKEEKTEEGKVIRSKAPLIWEGCFRKNFSTMDKIQITEISPPVIETSEGTYPVTLTLKGKGFSQVNEIIFSWRGHDSGQRVWRKGDQNWNKSLNIESDEKMTLKIYVLWNEPLTEKIKEWDWTVTLKNSQGDSTSKGFKVRQLPSKTDITRGSEVQENLKLPEKPQRLSVKEVIKPSQLIFYRQQNAGVSFIHKGLEETAIVFFFREIKIWGKVYKDGLVLTFPCYDPYDRYTPDMPNPEVDFLIPKKQGRLYGILGLENTCEFVSRGYVGDEAVIGIYGDGRLLSTFSLQVGKPPEIVNLDVSGIERLTIRLENFKKIIQICKNRRHGGDLSVGFADPISEDEE